MRVQPISYQNTVDDENNQSEFILNSIMQWVIKYRNDSIREYDKEYQHTYRYMNIELGEMKYKTANI